MKPTKSPTHFFPQKTFLRGLGLILHMKQTTRKTQPNQILRIQPYHRYHFTVTYRYRNRYQHRYITVTETFRQRYLLVRPHRPPVILQKTETDPTCSSTLPLLPNIPPVFRFTWTWKTVKTKRCLFVRCSGSCTLISSQICGVRL